MKISTVFTLFFLLCTCIGFTQGDTTSGNISVDIFNRITKSVKEYTLDTTAAPDDKVTKKIIELRNVKGGFNINEAIEFKLEEDRQKKEVPKEEIEGLAAFFSSGNGKRWLDNATVWIYRNYFTYEELEQLVAFYKTPAGQKMATVFPFIMLQSLTAAEKIKELYTQQQLSKNK